MKRVRFSVAMSLDGYIAGPNGESDWIVMDPDIDFSEVMGAFDTVRLGRKTYEATWHHGGGGMPGMQAYVFSRTLRQADCPGVIVSDKPAETLSALKASRGKGGTHGGPRTGGQPSINGRIGSLRRRSISAIRQGC